jgi:hypothetical protein
MSYQKRSRSGPEIGVGGFSTSESMYAGTKSRKVGASKKRSKSFCIKAPTAGIMKTKRPRNKPHKF